MNTEPKPVEQRDTLDLLELVCQLHSRALNQPRNKNIHDAYLEARREMESRIKVNNNFVLADVVGRSEQLLCSCDNPNGFKEMEEGKEFCSQCQKPY
jgi:hypothetical protein